MTTPNKARGLLDQALELAQQQRFEEARPLAEEALRISVRESGVVEGNVSGLTRTCQLALMRCGADAFQVGQMIEAERLAMAAEKPIVLEAIEDPIDRGIVEQAVAFLKHPTTLKEVSRHRSDVSTVCTGYEMTGADVPPEIDDLHRRFIELECRQHLEVAELLLMQESPDIPGAEVHALRALDDATALSKGYGRRGFLGDVQALQQRLAALKQ